jgi:hypothetical protein
MPTLNYVSHSLFTVTVSYTDMPPATDVVFVHQGTGDKTLSDNGLLGGGGSGSAEIQIPSLSGGQYYLLGQVVDQPIARTVMFYLD